MSNPKWTPGPWSYVPAEELSHDAPGFHVVVALGGIIGGEADDPVWVIEDATNIAGEANAHLIAAAPDLYAALEAVVAIADRRTVEFDAARAALAKARGHSGGGA